MRLVRFEHGGAPAVPGVLTAAGVIPLSALMPDAPGDMKAVIGAWGDIAPKLARAKAAAIPLAEVKLAAPVDAPEKIMAIGLNYADHVEEAKGHGVKRPEHQVWFCKLPSSVNAPMGDVEFPKAGEKLDYEVELVAVIGKGGRHISKEDAPKAVFGYAVGNDVSVRDWQMKTPQWILGKSFDTHAPFGPAITTADEIGDPHRLAIKCWVNGQLRQNSNTRHLMFNIWDQIVELSKAVTLKPGDLIFTGTPGGVGLATEGGLLKVGDVVRCEIEELGVIENRIVAET